jgi:hypothetical protein
VVSEPGWCTISVGSPQLTQGGQRKGFARTVDVETENHRARLEPIVAVGDTVGRGSFSRQTLRDHLVFRRDAVRVAGQRLQHQRVRMQPPPLAPTGEQKRIQLQMLALQRT